MLLAGTYITSATVVLPERTAPLTGYLYLGCLYFLGLYSFFLYTTFLYTFFFLCSWKQHSAKSAQWHVCACTRALPRHWQQMPTRKATRSALLQRKCKLHAAVALQRTDMLGDCDVSTTSRLALAGMPNADWLTATELLMSV